MINKLTSRQFIIYSIIGLSGIALDFAFFALLVSSTSINPAIASMVSVSVGIINNFFLNARFNFKRKDHLFNRFASFYTVGLLGVFLSGASIWLLHNIFRVDPFLAKAVSLPFIVILQYFLNANVSFKGLPDEK